MSENQQWANIVLRGSRDTEIMEVIAAINRLTASRGSNRASVMVGCAQILSQCITDADPDIASEVRRGIVALIDGYATRTAVEKHG